MTIIGIDPGLDGAIAALSRDEVAVIAMPTIKLAKGRALDAQAVVTFLVAHRPDLAVIERQNIMPKQGITSALTTGTNYGILLGILAGLGIRHEIVTPQALKNAMVSGTDRSKGASILRAQQLFPHVSLRATENCTADHDGMAEALLFAEYGKRVFGHR